MKSVRLLPIVIFAAIALLLFKGFGLLTSGGYVLTGTTPVMASGGGAAKPAAGADGPTMSLPQETTAVDTSPVLVDQAPTMAKEGGAPAEAAAGHGAAAAPTDAAASGHGDPAAGHGDPATPAGTAPTETAAAAADPAAGAPVVPGVDCTAGASITVGAAAGCIDANGDAVPMKQDASGAVIPMASADGVSMSEKQILERLAQRRTELDALDAELKMRESLVQAAEKRIEERTAALQALEARINAMVDEKKSADEGEFSALVKMYEGMKPTDASTIFNQLDMKVLVRLARAINPRKMAPIMAKMDPKVAQDLTLRLADAQADPQVAMQPGDLASLPQIVGQ